MALERTKRRAAIVAAAIAIAAPAEGLRRVAYYDPPGILTVCRGHTGPDIDPRKVYSLDECAQFMDSDMWRALGLVNDCAPTAPDSVQIAFADAVFNLGPGIACDTTKSTAARLLKQEKWVEACDQLPRWDKARIGGAMVSLPGLTKRRALERNVCLMGLV